MNLTDRQFEILQTVEPVIIAFEPVMDGTGQPRPTELKYSAHDFVITEYCQYFNPADSPAWAAHRKTYVVKEVSNG